ncbi:MAG: hypothetical protein L0Z53_25575 [Acidobacteriales bacterium]|nr:hypothetical protein [Terriglobales bacterium]
MPSPRQSGRRATDHPLVFARGQIVLVTLNTPREKFWGALLELSPAGVSLRGIDLNSLDDFARQVKSGDAVSPGAVFFPMHRVERMELDARNGDIPSLCERFFSKTNHEFSEFVDTDSGRGSRAAATERRS